ncbi:hypothetical protein AgCh_008709 [Apium graveolens]
MDNASANDVAASFVRRRVNAWKYAVLGGEYLYVRCGNPALEAVIFLSRSREKLLLPEDIWSLLRRIITSARERSFSERRFGVLLRLIIASSSALAVFSRTLTNKSEEPRQQFISYEEPDKPIVGQLALAIHQNPVRALVHGIWMGFIDDDNSLVSLINKHPSKADFFNARRDMNMLTAEEKARLKTIWPADYGRAKHYWSYEFTKHALTAFGLYKPRYFCTALNLAEPYMAGGSKDLAAFLAENFEVGKSYPIAQVEEAMKDHVSVEVGLQLKEANPKVLESKFCLSGLTLAYDDERPSRNLVLRNHPPIHKKKENPVLGNHPPIHKEKEIVVLVPAKST